MKKNREWNVHSCMLIYSMESSDLMKHVWKGLKILIITILSFLAVMCIWVFIQTKVNPNKIPTIFGNKIFIVLSGSMESEVYKGDLVIVKNTKADSLEVNDIIAFRDKDNYVVTHRIIKIVEEDGKKVFTTKGDNNNTEDSDKVTEEQIEGKYVKKISGFGNVLLTMKKPLTLFIVLGVIVLGGIVWILFGNSKLTKEERNELERLRKEKEQIDD